MYGNISQFLLVSRLHTDDYSVYYKTPRTRTEGVDNIDMKHSHIGNPN